MKVLKKQQNVPVNVKVEGEKKMLRGVELHPTDTTGVFAVHTGRRGRPRLVESSQIVKVTVLGSASKKPVQKKHTEIKQEQPKRRVVVVRKSSK